MTPDQMRVKVAEACPDCIKARAKYDRLDACMARRGNFGIVPLPRTCKKHRPDRNSPVPVIPWKDYGNPRQG